MKLLIVTQTVDINDPVLGFFHEWLEEFSKHVESLTVICLKKGDTFLPDNIKILSLGKENKQSRIKYIINFYTYVWREKNNYDAVFVHMNPEYIVLGGLVWKYLKKKIALWYTHKHVGLRLRIAAFFSDIIFSASSESFRLETKKLIVTGHGINTETFIPSAIQVLPTELITIGRLSPVKDYMTLISAVKIVKQNFPNIHAAIVGGPSTHHDNVYAEKLHARVKEDGLSKEITFTGAIPHTDLLPLLHKAKIFVHMSETGSMDKAALEAMAAGLIVVSSNDALRNLLSPYDLMFAKKDPVDLARVLTRLIERPEEISALSDAFRNYVIEYHNLSKLIPNIINKIKELNEKSRA